MYLQVAKIWSTWTAGLLAQHQVQDESTGSKPLESYMACKSKGVKPPKPVWLPKIRTQTTVVRLCVRRKLLHKGFVECQRQSTHASRVQDLPWKTTTVDEDTHGRSWLIGQSSSYNSRLYSCWKTLDMCCPNGSPYRHCFCTNTCQERASGNAPCTCFSATWTGTTPHSFELPSRDPVSQPIRMNGYKTINVVWKDKLPS